MSDLVLRNRLVRVASSLPKGSAERRALVAFLAEQEAPKEATSRVAYSQETAEFVDWVILNFSKKPMSRAAMIKALTSITGDGPTPVAEQGEKAPKQSPQLKVGDLVIAKPDKAPSQNADSAETFKYVPGTIDQIDNEGVIVRYDDGRTARFFGDQTGSSTGLYRYTPKATYAPAAGSGKKFLEMVYFSKAGDVEPYRKFVVDRYIERGEARGEERQAPYYSGDLVAFRETKEGDVIATINAQQRPYPVSANPDKGRLLYVGVMGKRPNWKGDFARDVAKIIEEENPEE